MSESIKKVKIGSGFLRATLLIVLGLLLAVLPRAVMAADYQVKPVLMITMDNNGKPLRFPNTLFFDSGADELYLITGGRSQVSVFANDFLPLVSIGPGREVYTPQGGFVDQNGQVYLCQSPKLDKPARITILNAAFIVTREIPINDIPGAVNFIPRRVAVNRDGLIYVASQHRGVLVLDAEGNFLRWLQPKDQLSKRALAAAALQESSKDDEASEEPVVSTGDIPEEFRPAGEGERGLTPVQIRGVTIDSQGQIYLVSSETGKIYVYNAEETFLFSFGTKGGTPGRLSQPRGVAVDPVGKRMYVSDYMRHTILVYDEKGEFLFEFGGKGDAPGWFKFPTDVVVDRRGQVIVSDLFNHRLQVFEIQQWKEAPSLEHLLELAAPDAAAEQQVESAGDSEEAATPESSDEATEAVEPEITEEVLPEQDISSYPDQPAQ